MLSDLSSEYSAFMTEKTGRDEYATELTVLEDSFLSEERDMGCGGVVLYTADSRIVCPNTLCNRLDLVYEEMLPDIRKYLFPSA